MAARDVDLAIVGHDQTGAATRSAGANFDKLKRKADEIGDETERMASRGKRSVNDVAASFVKGATRIRAAGPYVVVALIAAAIMALPTVATVAGMGIVAGLGGGIAAIGLIFAAKSAEVKASFSALKTHVVGRLTEMSAVFKPTLLGISDQMRTTFDSFQPTIQKAFAKLAPVIEQFSGDFFSSLEQLKPAFDPIVDAFTKLAESVGPKLPGLMARIAGAITEISNALAANPEAIGSVIDGLGKLITALGKVIAWLIKVKAANELIKASFALLAVSAVEGMVRISAAIADMAADVLEALAQIPGPGQAAFRRLAEAARANSNRINGHLSKINTDKAQAEIRVAEARLKVLGGMKPTPEVRAEIAQLKAQIAAAKGYIASVKGKTVTITVINRIVKAASGKGNVRIKVPNEAAAGVSFARTAPGEGSRRTGGPSMPDINATTYVTLDGREIAAVYRTVVDQEISRQTFRARAGRRR